MQRGAFFRSFWLLMLSAAILFVLQVGLAMIPRYGSHFRYVKLLERFPLFHEMMATKDTSSLVAPVTLDAVADSILPIMLMDSLNNRPSDSLSMFLAQPGEELHPFFKALLALERKERKKVRVAWFGDSMIEGDLIVMSFRNEMQRQFGGEGVGMLPITSAVAGFRTTIQHRFSPTWKQYDLVSKREMPFPAGLFCTVYVPVAAENAEDPWVIYKPGKVFQRTSRFPQAWLYYGSPALRQDSLNTKEEWRPLVVAQTEANDGKEYALDTTGLIHRISLFNEPKDAITLKALSREIVPYYGISIESDSGILVDAFASRGNSGLALWALDDEILASFQSMLSYDLIILQYGTNAISPADTDYSWYLRSFDRVIKKLRRAFPTSAFLMVSVADRAHKEGEKMTTAPAVPAMVAVQKKLAQDNALDFVNLFEAMGGDGSMVGWVDREDPLANKDYTHFNFKGAKVVSGYIKDHVISSYIKWKSDSSNLKPPLSSIRYLPPL